MPALTKDKAVKHREGRRYSGTLATGAQVYVGSLLQRNSSGLLRTATPAPTERVAGVSRANAIGAASPAVVIEFDTGEFLFANSSAGDLIVAADIGADAFVVDDQTVAKTNGTNTRQRAGRITDVTAEGVWVSVGQP